MYLICLILIYYVKRRCRNLSFGQCKDNNNIPKLYVLDNFSCVKICQVAENQVYKKSFWTTLQIGGCPKRITSCLSVLSCRCVRKRALVEVFLCSILLTLVVECRTYGSAEFRILGYMESYSVHLLHSRINFPAQGQKRQVAYEYEIFDARFERRQNSGRTDEV